MRASRVRFAVGIAAAGVLAASGAAVATDDQRDGWRHGGDSRFRTELTGYEEVAPPTVGAISTTGDGFFRAAIAPDRRSVSWVLQYAELEGDVQQAHIHFGQRHTAGGVSVFLCTNLAPPAGVPAPKACPARQGTVRGTFTAADVLGPAGQGIEPGALEELVRAMRAGVTYANVHSTKWPGGEIRGQIGFGRGW